MRSVVTGAVAAVSLMLIVAPLGAQPVTNPAGGGPFAARLAPTAYTADARSNGGAVISLHCYNPRNPDCD